MALRKQFQSNLQLRPELQRLLEEAEIEMLPTKNLSSALALLLATRQPTRKTSQKLQCNPLLKAFYCASAKLDPHYCP